MPVDLADMKRELEGVEFVLFKQPRLSVVPVEEDVWGKVCEMGGGYDGDDIMCTVQGGVVNMEGVMDSGIVILPLEQTHGTAPAGRACTVTPLSGVKGLHVVVTSGACGGGDSGKGRCWEVMGVVEGGDLRRSKMMKLENLVKSIKSKVRSLKKSKKPYVKMDKSASVKVEIRSKKARKLIDKTLKVADQPGKRTIS
ncbi:Uncharacterized protein Fot_18666 [Forsythia ovata]|uniref:Uncharacterized protein n=1 Tax=Forsythia ovata TaxID=205694 RepID=A0ABD1VLM1_9LAMI